MRRKQEYSEAMDNNILRIVYTFFIGLMLALFVGLGISTFYEGPDQPEYPVSIEGKSEPTKEETDELRQYETDFRTYEKEMQAYSRNVSIIALIFAVALLAASLAFERMNKVIANGLLLGGLFTLLYSIIRGLISQDTKMTFVAVSIGLVIVLYLGYRHFADHDKTSPAKKKRA